MACLWRLPEDCVSRILSVTSPADACTMLAVSREFRRPADSNLVWNQFLPADSHQILISSSTPSLKFSSTKELFFLLSNSILVDGGSKAFALERSTGRKSYILSARELSISENSSWSWKSMEESRFEEVAELQAAERVEVEGKIRSERLTPNTKYGAYLVFKISDVHAYGLHSIPFETFIASGENVVATNTATLRDPADKRCAQLQGLFYGNRVQKMKERLLNKGDHGAARRRDDGWLEIQLGHFFVGSHSRQLITMGVMEIKGHHLKAGLILEGIHVRPNPSI